MIHTNFIRRQLTMAKQQSLIFVLCVALAILTLVGLNSFGSSVNQALVRDARELLAGDVVIDSSYAPTEALAEAIAELEAENTLVQSQIVSLFTVARTEAEDNSLLTDLKIVEQTYPFYGEVELASGLPLHDVLLSGTIIVEQLILDRLGLSIGDSLRVGSAMLTIGDVVLGEPDRPVNFFSFGPRILIAKADQESLDLVKLGSRVSYRTLIQVPDENNLEAVAARLGEATDPVFESLSTFRTSDSGLQTFFNNLLFFLSLVAIFTLILAGIGIQSALTAFLRERDNTIAIIKTLGGTNRFVTTHFLYVIAILGVVGTVLGLAGGFALQSLFPYLLADFLPEDIDLVVSWQVVLESLLLSIAVVAIFTYLPIDRLKELRPNFILRKESMPVPKGILFYAILLSFILFFTLLVLWQLDDLERTLYFMGGVLGLVIITALVTEGILYVLRRFELKQLDLRQAMRGLFRPRNATRAIIITLSSALAVVFTIYIVEQNLDSSFVQAYPEDAPNVFFLDIQPSQRDDFEAEIQSMTESFPLAVDSDGNESLYDTGLNVFPAVRAAVAAVNDEVPEWQQDDDENSREGQGGNGQSGNGQRDDDRRILFNLTYRTELNEDEILVEGDSLFDPNFAGGNQVSVLDMGWTGLQLGDKISFRIQGVPLEATITSLREQAEDSFGIFFTFVFEPEVLINAPHTILASSRIPVDEIAAMQNRIVSRFPNISVINLSETIATFSEIAGQLTQVIRFLTFFSIAAGVLIIVSSVYATRFARIQEAVYFKVLGAKSRFVLRVFALENFILGFISAFVALLLSQVGSWIVTTRVLELEYNPFIGASIIMMLGTILLVMAVGLVASIPILRQRPIRFLREQTQE
ncbi:MAG: FtsX-like permease family protein [Chloroflexota bacterium]